MRERKIIVFNECKLISDMQETYTLNINDQTPMTNFNAYNLKYSRDLYSQHQGSDINDQFQCLYLSDRMGQEKVEKKKVEFFY
jgi:hypothetical protein